MVVILRRALLVLVVPAFASLGGCELIAGVRDITETDAEGDDDALPPFADAADARAEADATVEPTVEAGGPDAIGSQDVNAEADGTVADAPRQEAGEAAALEATSDVDAEAEAGKLDAADGTVADAGVTYVLIDDMEGNTGQISAPVGGNGAWFTYSDQTDGGVEIPASSSTSAFPDSMVSPPRTVPSIFASLSGPTSTYAAEVHGMGFASFVGMGFNFKSSLAAYDASSYLGFVFWGRIGGDSSASTVRFFVPDANTLSAGMVCATCDDYFYADLTLTSTWKQFTVYYSDLAQQGFGVPQETSLDAAHLYKVLFQASTKAPPGEPFDIWIDDVYFISPPP